MVPATPPVMPNQAVAASITSTDLKVFVPASTSVPPPLTLRLMALLALLARFVATTFWVTHSSG